MTYMSKHVKNLNYIYAKICYILYLYVDIYIGNTYINIHNIISLLIMTTYGMLIVQITGSY